MLHAEAEAADDSSRAAAALARMAEIFEAQLGDPEQAIDHHTRALALQPGLLHKRRIYRRLRTGGLCCHVPARLASLGLDYAVSIRRLAPLALQLPPDHASRHAFGSWLSLLTMSPSRYSHRGLAPHKFAPMLGAHHSLKR